MSDRKLIVDANVLIDFLNSDFTILKEVNKFVGQVYVIDRLLVNEIPVLSFKDCQNVDLEIISPTEDIAKVAEVRIGQLSYIDRLILHMANDLKFDVITNDSELEKVCKNLGVKVIRELRLLIELAEISNYSVDKLIQIVERIHETNHLHINRRLVTQFINIVSKIRN